ncbi:MAG: hypothetical protein WCC77_00260, partial [Pseudolabrys sp.]
IPHSIFSLQDKVLRRPAETTAAERTCHTNGLKSLFDPSRKSSTLFAVTYEAATLPSGRAKLLSSG